MWFLSSQTKSSRSLFPGLCQDPREQRCVILPRCFGANLFRSETLCWACCEKCAFQQISLGWGELLSSGLCLSPSAGFVSFPSPRTGISPQAPEMELSPKESLGPGNPPALCSKEQERLIFHSCCVQMTGDVCSHRWDLITLLSK